MSAEKRLRRSRTDRILSGVCGGLGEYLALDPTLIRLVFALLIFAGGIGLWAYIILAIIVPVEGSAAVHPQEVMKENVAQMKETAGELGESLRTGWGGSDLFRRRAWAGGILILLGIFFLLSNLNLFVWLDWNKVWPVLLVIIGVALLVGRGRRG